MSSPTNNLSSTSAPTPFYYATVNSTNPNPLFMNINTNTNHQPDPAVSFFPQDFGNYLDSIESNDKPSRWKNCFSHIHDFQAFQITTIQDFEYHAKSAIIIGAMYFFFTVDRIMQLILEIRRRRTSRRQVHQSTITSILIGPKIPNEDNSKNVETRVIPKIERELAKSDKEAQVTPARKLSDAVLQKERADLVLSTRRQVAVLNVVDQVELKDHDTSSVCNQSFALPDDRIRRLSSSNTADSNTKVSNNNNESNDSEVAVDIRVVERRVIESAALEVSSVAIMIIFGSSANNFVDAMSLGAAFSDSIKRGISLGIAAITQQLPQEVGMLAILTNSGLGLKKAILFNLIPIALSYIGFIAGCFLDNVDESYDQYIFAISSGMYMYIFLGTLMVFLFEFLVIPGLAALTGIAFATAKRNVPKNPKASSDNSTESEPSLGSRPIRPSDRNYAFSGAFYTSARSWTNC
ncbi:hypothetical protein WR25_02804 [Diploscapter pachys]|uniref:Uncharacterized protein n=1 Tax=Diploscapter pachys TaxID=2018661 RepID=A0A2A2LXX7_9BILA|nr:hypothetical protein WR25_02804 [Diploscapter pachys]